MQVRARVIALVTIGVTLAVSLAHIERYESSFLFVTHHSVYDFIGAAKEQWNLWARNCDAVLVENGASPRSKEIEVYLNSSAVPGSGKASVLTAATQQDWYMVEVEFESLEPALLLLHREAGKYVWLQDATYSGSAGPWVAGPVIREFMRSKAPAAPKQLVQCFRPKLPHFAARVGPNPSLKPSPNGKPPGPGLGYAVHFPSPGPGVLPSGPA